MVLISVTPFILTLSVTLTENIIRDTICWVGVKVMEKKGNFNIPFVFNDFTSKKIISTSHVLKTEGILK